MATVIFKATEACNSNCIYCEVVKKHQPAVMGYDLLAVVFQRMNEYLAAHSEEKIIFTWHGGEACLLGVEYFKKALELQEKYCPQTKARIRHQIQSNLTLITQELIDAFKALGISRIGSSFDPLPTIRGFGPSRDSRRYNEMFMDGINLLKENAIPWGMIYVVHRRSLGLARKLFYYLTNLNFSSQPTINKIYLYRGDPSDLSISQEEFADFLGELLPLYWENRVRFPNLQPISRFVERVVYDRKASVCDYSGKCAYAWVYIGPTGMTSQCGRSGDFEFTRYGAIQDHSLEDILHHPMRNMIEQRQELLPREGCRDCRFWGICHGGCPLDALAEYNTFLKPSPNCAWVKLFLEKYLEPTVGVRINLPPEGAFAIQGQNTTTDLQETKIGDKIRIATQPRDIKPEV